MRVRALALFVFVFCCAAYAEDRYIGNVMSEGADAHYTIVVETVPKKMYLLRIEGDNQNLLDAADILTGRENGSKLVQNDGKTPEGVYYFVDFMNDTQMIKLWGEEVAYKYGIASYHTNYPNPIDKIMKRTGYGIWLHGLDPDRHKPATEGCVAAQNTELERMQPYLSVGMPIVIVNDVQFFSAEDYKQQRTEHLQALRDFISAWNSGDYEVFAASVHPQYSSYAAKSAKEYLANKKALMQSYPNRQIDIENINVYRQNDVTLVYDFDQFYCADNIVTFGNKRFYLVTDNGTDKLISEEIRPKSTQAYLEPHVKAFVESWRQAWESKDIEEYMKYYAPNFPSRKAWADTKEKLFEMNENISVDVSDLRWESAGGNNIRVSFRQGYKSDINSDLGTKTLLIAGCPGNYSIKSENWSAR